MIVQIPSNIAIWPLVVVAIALLSAVLVRRKPSFSYFICFFIFTIYIMLVLDKTLLPIEISGPYVDDMRQRPFMSGVNLIPFCFGPFGTLEGSITTLVLNIVLTIPFGFGVNFVAQAKPRKLIWLAIAVGFVIETAQLVISLLLGYPYRVIDINDVIMNTLGVLIGYGGFRVFAWLYLLATRHLNLRHWGLTAYVYDVARQAATASR